MTKAELLSILKLDLKRFGNKRPGLKDRILHNESYYIWTYIEHMRYLEYYGSSGNGHCLLSKIAYLWHFYFFKHLQFKLHFAIYPNTLGPGFRIYHVGAYTHIGPNVKIGKNCTMVSGVVFGNKTEAEDDSSVIVGDNCYFGLDCKILGAVRIGNNVTVGANTIITKNIPDNAIVGGVNKILGYNK